METIGTWPLIPALLVVVGGFTFVTILGSTCVCRLAPHRVLANDNDIKGVVLSIIGVVYAVVLGFVAIGVWDRFDQAEVRTYAEAANLQEIYRDADAFPERAAIRSSLRTYTASIVTYDWNAMGKGAQAPLTRVQIERLGSLLRSLSASTPNVQDVHAQMLSALRASLRDRDTRLAMADTGLDPIMYAVLFIGAFVTVGFACAFGFTHARTRHFVIASLGAMIGLVLYMTMSLDYPFRGAVKIEPQAFTHALYNYDLIDQAK